MMTTLLKWLNAPWLLALLVASGFTLDGFVFCLNASEWASWVQAVGSILAIAGAVLISQGEASRQRVAANDQAKQELINLLKTVIAMAQEGQAICDRSLAIFRPGYRFADSTPNALRDGFRSVLEVTGNIPFWRMNAYGIAEFSKLRIQLTDGMEHVSRLESTIALVHEKQSNEGLLVDTRYVRSQAILSMRKSLDILRTEFDKTIDALNGEIERI